jgi:hypothetical protein
MSDTAELSKKDLLHGCNYKEKQDDKWHFGLSVDLLDSIKNPTSLLIPDAGSFDKKAPIMFTKPFTLKPAYLCYFLGTENGAAIPDHAEDAQLPKPNVPEKLWNSIKDLNLVVGAFYYSDGGPCLMEIEITSDSSKGLVGELFPKGVDKFITVKALRLRAFKSKPEDYKLLEEYVELLTEKSKAAVKAK